MFELLTPGQKLKKLRKELHLTQAQLASSTISREFISMVEHDLRRLSYENACSLMDELKKIAVIQKVPFNYSTDYLNLSSEEDFHRYVKSLDMTSTSVETLEKLYEQSIQLTQIEAQGILLKALAKKYIYSSFNKSFFYFTSAKDIFIVMKNNQEVMKINNNLGALCQIHNKLEEACVYLELALFSNTYQLPESDKYTITLNLALVYSKLELHNKCLALLNKQLEEDYCKTLTEQKINTLVLRAVSLSESGNQKAAMSLIAQLEKHNSATGIQNSYLQSNKIYILRKTNLELAIAEQHKLIESSVEIDLKIQNLAMLGDLYFENNNLIGSLNHYQSAVTYFNPETYPELQLSIYDKIIRNHQAMGSLTKDILNEVICFCQTHHFKDSLLKFGLLYLELSKSLSEDDSRIVNILNTSLHS